MAAKVAIEPFAEGVLCITDAGQHFPQTVSTHPHVVHEKAAMRLWGVNGQGLPAAWLEAAIGAEQASLETASREDSELIEQIKLHRSSALNEMRVLLDVLTALRPAADGRAPNTQPLPGLELSTIELYDDPRAPPHGSRAELVGARTRVQLDSKVRELAAASTRLRRVAVALDERAQREDERAHVRAQLVARWSPADLRGYDDVRLLVACGGRTGVRRAARARTDAPDAPIAAAVHGALLQAWVSRHHRRAFDQMRIALLGGGGGARAAGVAEGGRVGTAYDWAPMHVSIGQSAALATDGALAVLTVSLLPERLHLAEGDDEIARATGGDARAAEGDVRVTECDERAAAAAREPTEAAPLPKRARLATAPAEAAAALAAAADAGVACARAEVEAEGARQAQLECARAGTLSALLGALALLPAGRLPSEAAREDDRPGQGVSVALPPSGSLQATAAAASAACAVPGKRTSGALLERTLRDADVQLRAARELHAALAAIERACSSASVPVRASARPLARLAAARAGLGAHGAARAVQWPLLGGGLRFEVTVCGERAFDGSIAHGVATLRAAGPASACGPSGPGSGGLGFARRWEQLESADDLRAMLTTLAHASALAATAARLARARALAAGLGYSLSDIVTGDGSGAAFVATHPQRSAAVHVCQRTPRLPLCAGVRLQMPSLEPLDVAVESAQARDAARLAVEASPLEPSDVDGFYRLCACLRKDMLC